MEVKDKRFTKREEVLSELLTSSPQRYDSLAAPVTHCHASGPENYPQLLFNSRQEGGGGRRGEETKLKSESDSLWSAQSVVFQPADVLIQFSAVSRVS